MKFARVFVWVWLLLGIAVGCGNMPTRIVSATLGKNVQAGKIADATAIFAPVDRMIHLVVEVENITGPTTVGAKWYTFGPPESLLFESDLALDPLNTSADFSLTNSGDWKPGSYKVDVYLNGEKNRTLNFGVKGATDGE